MSLAPTGGDAWDISALLREFQGPRLVLIRAAHGVAGLLSTYGLTRDQELCLARPHNQIDLIIISRMHHASGDCYRMISIVARYSKLSLIGHSIELSLLVLVLLLA